MGVAGGQGVDAGWYDDHRTAGAVRWYDGSAWTEHTRPVSPVPNPPATNESAVVPSATMTYAPAVAGTFASSAPGYQTGHAGSYGGGAAYSPVPTHPPQHRATFGAPASTAPSQFGGFGAQAPAWGQPFGATATFGGAAYPGMLTNQSAIDSVRRRVLRDFWFGVGFLLLGSLVAFWVTATISSAGGYGGGRHYISTAGVISGLVSFYRAGRNYKAMLALGGTPWSAGRMTSAVVVGSLAVLLSAIAIVHAYTATGSSGTGPAVAGSCWAGGNGSVWQVSCDSPHSFQATAVISDGGACPNATDHVLSLNDRSGNALCLAPSLSSSAG